MLTITSGILAAATIIRGFRTVRSAKACSATSAPIAADYRPADYRADTSKYAVVGSVHVEAVPSDAAVEVAWLEGAARPQGLAQAIVARVELQRPDAERSIDELARFPSVRGIRHIVNWHSNPAFTFTDRDFLTDAAWRQGFRLLRKFGLSFDLQIYPGQMAAAAELAAENPDTLIVLNHTGMPVDRDVEGVALWHGGLRRLAERQNVVAKISGLGMVDHRWSEGSIRPFVLRTIDLFGADRVMFGSNFPVDRLYSSFDTLYSAFEAIVVGFSEDEKDRLFRANALRIYRID